MVRLRIIIKNLGKSIGLLQQRSIFLPGICDVFVQNYDTAQLTGDLQEKQIIFVSVNFSVLKLKEIRVSLSRIKSDDMKTKNWGKGNKSKSQKNHTVRESDLTFN